MAEGSEDQGLAHLRYIGDQLDRGIEVRVGNGGVVMPNDEAAPLLDLGGDVNHATERQRRSETRPRKGPPGGEGTSRRSRTAGAHASVGRTDPHAYRNVRQEVAEAYPGAEVWHQENGFWLVAESRILPREFRRVRFVVACCAARELVKGWAFWISDLSDPVHIGPRHTYFEGEICAYPAHAGIWSFGDSMVRLLDFYTVWAFRHLYLERVGRWPGHQVTWDPNERIVECRSDELCGCQNPAGRYRDCCAPKDAQRDQLEALLAYRAFYGPRQPPEGVTRFVSVRRNPPELAQIFALRMSDLRRFWPRSLSIVPTDGMPLRIIDF